jgi:hypothetical protein
MKYPPNIYERDALIEVSLKVIPCMKCSRLFKKGGNSMSSMRCDRCHSSAAKVASAARGGSEVTRMKLAFEFILFHENADGTTTFFQFHIVGVPLKGRDEKITDQTQRREDQEVAGQVAQEGGEFFTKDGPTFPLYEPDKKIADSEEGQTKGVVVRR